MGPGGKTTAMQVHISISCHQQVLGKTASLSYKELVWEKESGF